ncbi:hypothetical protein Tco_0550730 [Tanacetum coccineum]
MSSPISVIPETTNLPPIPEIVTETPVSTAVPSPQVTPIISSVQQTPTLIPTPPITTDAPTVTIDSQVPTVVDSYLDTKVRDSSDILKIKKEQDESQKNPQFMIKSTNKATLEEYDLKSALYQSMHANKYFNRNPANHRLYYALMEALTEDENAMDKGVADTGKKTKRRRTKESESSKKPSSTKETPKGQTLTKGSKTGKSTLANESVEESIAEVIINDASDDVVHGDDQPQAASKPKLSKTLNPEMVQATSKPPTPDQNGTTVQVVHNSTRTALVQSNGLCFKGSSHIQ